MIKENVLALEKVQAWSNVTQFAFVFGITLMAPFFQQQVFSGIMVNAMLFVATVILGVRAAVILAFLPSVIAFSMGTLPVALAPMIPYIMISNILLIFVFDFFRKKNYWLGMILASVGKFSFLFLMSHWIFDIISQKTISTSVMVMMSWPQLLTALFGGMLAYGIILFLARNEVSPDKGV
ncbi:MAG: hypothetical protein IPN70_04540 [Candidatus Moraniibacteriota bacterium]|nr:MAG: hypothetical protein IPN70_04540 [Candidatus Moranbacteria bacterium]